MEKLTVPADSKTLDNLIDSTWNIVLILAFIWTVVKLF